MNEKEVRDALARRGITHPGLVEGLTNYLVHKIPTGHFLGCLLANDLVGTYRRADEESRRLIPDLVRFLVNDAPLGAWGSEATVSSWLGR